jgi:hypothetical protein
MDTDFKTIKEITYTRKILVEVPKGYRQFERPRREWKNMKRDFKKHSGRFWIGFIRLRTGVCGRLGEYGDKIMVY